jgi:nicotinamide phosphoribosyltransferase
MLELVKPFNFITAVDSYKLSHWEQIPENATHAVSLIVPRKASKFSDIIVAMGQTFTAHILATVRIENWMIHEAEIEATEQGYNFDRKCWEIIVDELDGRLPLAMYGIEEGTQVQPQTPITGLVNTDPRFAKLPAYVETWCQAIAWKMSTVATTCRASRVILRDAMIASGADLAYLDYKLHNFGDRGADSPQEAPVIAGISHAALFNGSDCTRANSYIKALYGDKEPMTSSVEATEHSVTCMNSDAATKDDFNMVKKIVTERIPAAVARTKRGIGLPFVSGVIDTYDARRWVLQYVAMFKDEIANSGGKFVQRPDSGDPTLEPAQVARDLEHVFGIASTTSTGHKDLPGYVGILQGDGINVYTLKPVATAFIDAGYSMNNILFGMGGGTTHDGGRDTFSFSQKNTAYSIDGGKTWIRLLKAPKTDMSKASLSGLVRPEYIENIMHEPSLCVVDYTIQPEKFFESSPGWRLYSKDGERVWKTSFKDVRIRSRTGV